MSPPLSQSLYLRAIATTLSLLLLFGTRAGAETFSEHAAAIQTLLASGQHQLLRDGDFRYDQAALQQLYERRGFQSVWIQNREPTRQGVLLLQTLRGADEFGLRPDDYDATQLVYDAIDLITTPSASPAQQAELDLALSVAAARFVRHLHLGRIDPWAGGFALNRPRAPFAVAAVLEQLASGDDFAATVTGIEPQFLYYQLAKRALQRYRLLAIDGELTQLPPLEARSIKPGEPYDGIPQLRRLLVAVGDLPDDAAAASNVLDEVIAEGVRSYQRRHGLTVDGALGRKTFAALTTPLSVRAEQLALTLERWRWLPEFESPPIVVNIPQFKLFALEGAGAESRIAFESDVIVGKAFPTQRTPAFIADMRYIVFRPYWEVPTSILQNEILPEVRANARYLEKNNLEIVSATDANGQPIALSAESLEQLAAGKLRLRQRPGESNSLGLVKLMLPNAHSVYLHSTPARRLFDQARRAFSHGCIRVNDVVGLVQYALRDEPGDWNRETIEAAMHDESPTGNNRHVFLSKTIPVAIVYGTALASEDGRAHFFDDIYGYDAKLKKLLR